MMKKLFVYTILFFISFQIYCQQWYSMGFLDTLASFNGDKEIYAITFYNNKITVGGDFKYTGTAVLNSVAQWGGTQWQRMSTGLWESMTVQGNGGAFAYCEYHNKLYCVGDFEGAGGIIFNPNHYAYNIAKWDTTDWYPMTQPTDGFNSGGTALGVYHNNLYAGNFAGNAFDSSGSLAAQGIARWNDTVFSAVGQLAGDFPPDGYFGAMAFTNCNNKLIVGGFFTSINGTPYGTYNGIATWNDTAWGAMGNGFNNAVLALTVFNGEVYAGGIFDSSRDGTTALNHIAKWNGTTWVQVGEGLNDTVNVLTVDSVHNKLYAGGGFTQTGLGVPAKHIAEWTGTNWQEVGGGTNRDVRALYAKDSNLYVGGFFTRAGNVQADLIACWCVNSPLGINEPSKENEITISPNPTTSHTTITFSSEQTNTTIKITDILGQGIRNYELGSSPSATLRGTKSVTLDMSGYAKGIYFVQITDANKNVVNRKIIKN